MSSNSSQQPSWLWPSVALLGGSALAYMLGRASSSPSSTEALIMQELRELKRQQQRLQRSTASSAASAAADAAGGVVEESALRRSGSAEELLAGDEVLAQLQKMAAENKRLQRLVDLHEATHALDSESAKDQSRGALTPAEVETMRVIFDQYDENKNGCIEIGSLKKLHKRMGEPLTDDEARAAMRSLDPDNKGEVSFQEFLNWWYQTHRGRTKNDTYTKRFKLISAKLQHSDFDVSRVVTKAVGDKQEFRVMFNYKQRNGTLRRISPWHDIPLLSVGSSGQGSRIFNMVVEIPKWTRAKYEIATGEEFNPIKQDTKNGQLRFYKHGDMAVNYGAFPQTWESPDHIPPQTGFPGDNDPIDVLEIGTRQLKTGEIVQVKVLGVLALIDDKETDWKVIAINIHDVLAVRLNDIDDVERELPGIIHHIREYLRNYKSYSGQFNSYALRGEALSRDEAHKVIMETHEQWKSLRDSKRTTVGSEAKTDE